MIDASFFNALDQAGPISFSDLLDLEATDPDQVDAILSVPALIGRNVPAELWALRVMWLAIARTDIARIRSGQTEGELQTPSELQAPAVAELMDQVLGSGLRLQQVFDAMLHDPRTRERPIVRKFWEDLIECGTSLKLSPRVIAAAYGIRYLIAGERMLESSISRMQGDLASDSSRLDEVSQLAPMFSLIPILYSMSRMRDAVMEVLETEFKANAPRAFKVLEVAACMRPPGVGLDLRLKILDAMSKVRQPGNSWEGVQKVAIWAMRRYRSPLISPRLFEEFGVSPGAESVYNRTPSSHSGVKGGVRASDLTADARARPPEIGDYVGRLLVTRNKPPRVLYLNRSSGKDVFHFSALKMIKTNEIWQIQRVDLGPGLTRARILDIIARGNPIVLSPKPSPEIIAVDSLLFGPLTHSIDEALDEVRTSQAQLLASPAAAPSAAAHTETTGRTEGSTPTM